MHHVRLCFRGQRASLLVPEASGLGENLRPHSSYRSALTMTAGSRVIQAIDIRGRLLNDEIQTLHSGTMFLKLLWA